MEGISSRPSESASPDNVEVFEDTDSKDKKKKSKKSATTLHSRIDAGAEKKADSRLRARQELGSVSLYDIVAKQKNDKKSESYANDDTQKNYIPSLGETAATNLESVIDLPEHEAVEVETSDYEYNTENNHVGVEIEGFDDEHEQDGIEVSEEIELDEIQPTVDESADDSTYNDDEPAEFAEEQIRVSGSGVSQSVPPAAMGGGGSVPPRPPIQPPPSSATPPPPAQPQPPHRPQQVQPPQFGYNNPSATTAHSFNTQSSNNLSLNQAPRVEQRVIEKHNHFIAGLIVGGLYEHFKHKKNEKKLTKEIKTQNTKTEEQSRANLQNQTEITALKTEQTQQDVYKKWQEKFEPVLVPVLAEKRSVPDQAEPFSQPLRAETATIPLQISAEQSKSVQEQTTVSPERITALPEILHDTAAHAEAPVVAAINEADQYVVPDDRRLETSSWHKIEIDKATGRPVENPSFAYGEAFQMERQQEVRQQDDSTTQQSTDDVNSTTGSVSNSVAPDGTQSQSRALPLNTTTPESRHNITEETQRIDTAKPKDAVSVGLWGVLVVLVIAILYVAV